MDNVVTRLTIELGDDDHYRVSVTKRFAPEFGGGEETISVGAAYKSIHTAVDIGKMAVTVTPADREEFKARDGRGW